jgi:hypothetical protein
MVHGDAEKSPSSSGFILQHTSLLIPPKTYLHRKQKVNNMMHGSTDDLKTADTHRLLPSHQLSVERDWYHLESVEEETAFFDDAGGCSDVDNDVARPLRPRCPPTQRAQRSIPWT